MKAYALITTLSLFGLPAYADMVMTLDWPSQTREGDQYLIEVIGYNSEVSGNILVTTSPSEALDIPLGDAAKMCIFAIANSQPITVLHGPFHGEIIPIVPERATGKICISMFAQKSATWTVEF